MYNICVFAGTTEGRELVEFLCSQRVSVTVCVATEYGETLLPTAKNLEVLSGRLPEDKMVNLLGKTRYDLVIDATHPYAAAVTESIFSACSETGTRYLRLLRGASAISSDMVYAENAEAAAEFLDTTDGNILLTTGSKELGKFAHIKGFSERVYARVLPMESSLASCAEAGLKAARIIAVQGPFSEEMNLAMLRFSSAAWLVTKDGGDAGGFEAKINAAEKAGVRVVVIGRPPQLDGVSFSETIELLCKEFGCRSRAKVSVVGIGPGSKDAMTREACRAIERADCLIGAKRMLEAVAAPGQQVYDAIAPADIAGFIKENSRFMRFAVVMSGDVGFFSGTKKLLPLLDGCDVELLPGLSSLVYLCARLKTSYEDVVPVSVHGRNHDITRDVRGNSRVFALVGGENGMAALCKKLTDAGLGDVRVSVGERLSYPDEKITRGSARELASGSFEALSVALIENDFTDSVVTHGLADSEFQRGEGAGGVIPMTKSEVRSVCLSKLRLTERSVCWDVGAGTGSVAIEMALQAKKGSVYAIERKEDAVELIEQNKARFSAENLSVISGAAPEACYDLPAPSHAFIGGSSGNMRDIIRLLMEKNSSVRIVATAVSLESVSELTACLKEFPFAETEVVSVQTAYGRKAGAYNLMTAQNPIYIFTMQCKGEH